MPSDVQSKWGSVITKQFADFDMVGAIVIGRGCADAKSLSRMTVWVAFARMSVLVPSPFCHKVSYNYSVFDDE